MRNALRRQAKLLVAAGLRWQADDGPTMSAAVAYYLGLSLFPLLLILIAGIGVFLRHSSLGQDAERQILDAVAEQASPEISRHVATILEQVRHRSSQGGPIGIAGVVIAAIAGFAQLERAFDHMWNIPPRKARGLLAALKHTLIERGIAFLMLLAMGLLVVVVFLAGIALQAVETQWGRLPYAIAIPGPALRLPMTLAINAGLFTLLYRFLPKRPVTWKGAFRGGAFAAIGWEIGRQLLGTILVGDKYSAYGVVGSFLALLLWCYYAVGILLLAGEYLQVCVEANSTSDDVDQTAARLGPDRQPHAGTSHHS